MIATDIPTALRRPGEYRGVLHETDGQAAMFAPVVEARTSRAPRPVATPRPRRPLRRRRRPGPCTWRSPTDLLAAEAPDASAAPSASHAFRSATGALDAVARSTARGARCLGRRRRARRGRAVRALAERLAAPVLTTYGAAGVLPPGPPLAGGAAAARRARGRSGRGDVVIAIGRDLDGCRRRTSPSRSR